MNKLAIYLLLMIPVSTSISAQVAVIDKTQLLELTGKENDTTYVINFWATWCSPCIKEIGYFEELHQSVQGKDIKVLLISLDFPNRIEKQLLPFLKEKSLTAPVYLMTDLDYNNWIDRVDPSWSGAIPATLIFNRSRKIFLEKELSREELFKHVNQISQ